MNTKNIEWLILLFGPLTLHGVVECGSIKVWKLLDNCKFTEVTTIWQKRKICLQAFAVSATFSYLVSDYQFSALPFVSETFFHVVSDC